MGAVLTFPTLGRLVGALCAVDGCSDESIAREARMKARAAGCNGAQAELVGAHAEGLLRRAWSRQRVLDDCRRYAAELLNPQPPSGPVAA